MATAGSPRRPERQPRPRREWTLDDRRERSLQLADERGGGMWAVHFVEAECDPWSGELLRLTVEVDSARDAETRYTAVYDAETDWASCACAAAANLAPCHHAGKAIVYGRYAVEAYAEGVRDPFGEARREANEEALRPSL